MRVGLLLLVYAALGGAYVPVEQVRWFIGALAAFSTMRSGFLTKTYLEMYRESIRQLNRYFDQPMLNSYYLTAERLAGGLSVDRLDTVRCQIINEVLATSSHLGTKTTDPAPKAARNIARLKKRRPPRQRAGSSGQQV
ncbi:hypothetical protein [Streptomyces mirabilis]